MNSDLKSGDVVLVVEGGWGLIHQDMNKYVELVDYKKDGFFGQDGWTIRPYDGLLQTLITSTSMIGVKSFGESPLILFNTKEGSVEQDITTDRGKHYRYSFRLNLTQDDIDEGFVMVNIDPYRISEVYNLGGWREHLVKKAIRGTEKGHTEDELLDELQCTLDRARQMLEESRE